MKNCKVFMIIGSYYLDIYNANIVFERKRIITSERTVPFCIIKIFKENIIEDYNDALVINNFNITLESIKRKLVFKLSDIIELLEGKKIEYILLQGHYINEITHVFFSNNKPILAKLKQLNYIIEFFECKRKIEKIKNYIYSVYKEKLIPVFDIKYGKHYVTDYSYYKVLPEVAKNFNKLMFNIYFDEIIPNFKKYRKFVNIYIDFLRLMIEKYKEYVKIETLEIKRQINNAKFILDKLEKIKNEVM